MIVKNIKKILALLVCIHASRVLPVIMQAKDFNTVVTALLDKKDSSDPRVAQCYTVLNQGTQELGTIMQQFNQGLFALPGGINMAHSKLMLLLEHDDYSLVGIRALQHKIKRYHDMLHAYPKMLSLQELELLYTIDNFLKNYIEWFLYSDLFAHSLHDRIIDYCFVQPKEWIEQHPRITIILLCCLIVSLWYLNKQYKKSKLYTTAPLYTKNNNNNYTVEQLAVLPQRNNTCGYHAVKNMIAAMDNNQSQLELLKKVQDSAFFNEFIQKLPPQYKNGNNQLLQNVQLDDIEELIRFFTNRDDWFIMETMDKFNHFKARDEARHGEFNQGIGAFLPTDIYNMQKIIADCKEDATKKAFFVVNTHTQKNIEHAYTHNMRNNNKEYRPIPSHWIAGCIANQGKLFEIMCSLNIDLTQLSLFNDLNKLFTEE